MSQETDLLDNLEDAQEAYDWARRTFKVLLPVSAVFTLGSIGYFVLLSCLHSVGVDWGSVSGFPGLLGFVVAVVSAALCGMLGFEELPDTRKALKKAQRAHRNFLMSDNREGTT
jgi:hypothetical protein